MRKKSFYPMMALQNIVKNRRFFVPYLLTITGTSAARAGPAPRQPSSSPAAASARKHKSRSPCALPFLFRSN